EETLRRGGYVLVATVDDDLAEEAVSRLESAGAVDLDERSEQWRAAGWRGSTAEATGIPIPRDTVPAERPSASDTTRASSEAALRADDSSTRAAAAQPGSTRIPVVEEQLRVGKREINRGSVRVRSYIEEVPVQENVRL